jgi:hypothetical protein
MVDVTGTAVAIYVVALVILIAALVVGVLAFRRQPNKVFGGARVFHILFAIFMPPLELILGGVELAS